MELHFRRGSDAFVPPGAYRQLEMNLRQHAAALADIPTLVMCCFDKSTRLMPFVIYDKWMFPAGARTVAGALLQAGFERIRAVYQLWTPNVRPTEARIDGRAPQLLLVSTMQMHAVRAAEAIADAWKLGEDRPLILVGGSKAFHEPYHFWSMPTANGPIAPDAVVTGEAYILLDLMNLLMGYHRPGEHIRKAFERARKDGALNSVPGLIYLDPRSTLHEPVLIDTGLQRLVQHLDELPDEVRGLSVLEPPHKKTGLMPAALDDKNVRRHAAILGMIITQGCKFNCSYCPIPALNQKTWRFRSPENLVRQFRTIREQYGIKNVFGADDNFMNRRETAADYFEALARAEVKGKGGLKRLGGQVRWSTEATQFDTYKNRDLLPLASRAGMFGIWFGIEDLTAELINKGQKPEVTVDLFRIMTQNRICPMAMIMFHAEQPFSSRNSLYGLTNQLEFLRRAGAVSVQVTTHIPAVGTREYENSYNSGKVLKKLGNFKIEGPVIDGNHVVVADSSQCWRKQIQLLGGYFSFYNPLNMWRAMRESSSPLRMRRLAYQGVGLLGTLWTAWKMIPYTLRLAFSKNEFATEAPPLSHVPVHLAPGAFPRFAEGDVYEPQLLQIDKLAKAG